MKFYGDNSNSNISDKFNNMSDDDRDIDIESDVSIFDLLLIYTKFFTKKINRVFENN